MNIGLKTVLSTVLSHEPITTQHLKDAVKDSLQMLWSI